MQSAYKVFVDSLTSPKPQFDGLGEVDTHLSDPKLAKFWTLQPITLERFIRFGQTWLENDSGDFLFKIEHH